jgi:NADH dehydrogenase FAD-containing subunit
MDSSQLEAADAAAGSSTFTLKDAPIENQRPLKVVVIGAGYSGILAAIRYVLPHRRRH